MNKSATQSALLKATLAYERAAARHEQAQERRHELEEDNYGRDLGAIAVERAWDKKYDARESLKKLLLSMFGEANALRVLAAENREGGISGLVRKIEAQKA
tara:strand:+ start:975 stop:1277 length:303 start_codon:yes stop_codon:yes gene_type:complete